MWHWNILYVTYFNSQNACFGFNIAEYMGAHLLPLAPLCKRQGLTPGIPENSAYSLIVWNDLDKELKEIRNTESSNYLRLSHTHNCKIYEMGYHCFLHLL